MRTPVLLLAIAFIFRAQPSAAQTTQKSFADTTFEPVIFGYTDNEIYSAIGNKIYGRKGNEIKWRYAFVLPFSTDSGSLSMKDYKTILFSRFDDSLFYYSIADAKVQKRYKKEMFDTFCKKRIQMSRPKVAIQVLK